MINYRVISKWDMPDDKGYVEVRYYSKDEEFSIAKYLADKMISEDNYQNMTLETVENMAQDISLGIA